MTQEPRGNDEIASLAGHAIGRIELDSLIRIVFGEGTDLQLCVESAFQIVDDGGDVHDVRYVPSSTTSRGLDALPSLRGLVVRASRIRPDGSLQIDFTNGTALLLPVDPLYEAGHLVTPDDYIVVPPGGRLG